MKEEESRGLDVFFVFGREKKRAEIKTQKSSCFWSRRVPGAIYSPMHILRGGGICRASTLKVPPIRLILTPLKISRFPDFEKVWNLKMQWSDQKL